MNKATWSLVICLIFNIVLLFLPNNKSRWVTVICIVLMASLLGYELYRNWAYEVKDLGNGMLWSRKYGMYPKVIKNWQQGMSIMPQQTAEIHFQIPPELREQLAKQGPLTKDQKKEAKKVMERLRKEIGKDPEKYFSNLPDCRDNPNGGDCMYKIEPEEPKQ